MKIIEDSPYSEDAELLIKELSETLTVLTGSSGENSFHLDSVCAPRALFVIAYFQEEPVGCGAIQPLNQHIAEVKRMYAKLKGKGVGTQILSFLEQSALNFGYSAIWLETRRINQSAVTFYQKNGYNPIRNYGKYSNRPEAICFEKQLGSS
ncbi:GNAT family N-acetyltransferase [Niallia sp. 03133]|uniref:GNAT family N-acetyltransferase n=1 Tax=Niallia sp. 03133 TaxID=3458060 RepID=UPI004044E49F